LPRLPYTEMVVAESMRLYPPAWAMGRQATEDVEIGPYRVPEAGVMSSSANIIVHRDAKYFPDPLAFRSGALYGRKPRRNGPSSPIFLLAEGGRQCIGESFAWMEAVLVLATLAQRWRLNVVEQQQIALQPKITLRPQIRHPGGSGNTRVT
jgi:cytochrome P450